MVYAILLYSHFNIHHHRRIQSTKSTIDSRYNISSTKIHTHILYCLLKQMVITNNKNNIVLKTIDFVQYVSNSITNNNRQYGELANISFQISIFLYKYIQVCIYRYEDSRLCVQDVYRFVICGIINVQHINVDCIVFQRI